MYAANRGRSCGVTVWYDGDCPICVREVALLQRLDAQEAIDFRDISQIGREDDLPAPRQDLLARFHAAENGRLLNGAAAFALVWRNIPRLRWAGKLAASPPVLWGLERAYSVFLRLRPRLQAAARRLQRRRRNNVEA